MNKTWLIVQREFITRVKKKSFLIMTILGPVLFAALMIMPVWLATQSEDSKHILVLDEIGVWNLKEIQNRKLGIEKDTTKSIYTSSLPQDFGLEAAKELLMKDESYYALLYIPMSKSDAPDLKYSLKLSKIYGRKEVSLSVKNYFERKLQSNAQSNRCSNGS